MVSTRTSSVVSRAGDVRQSYQAVNLLGVRIDRLRRRDLLDLAIGWAKARTRRTILYVNIHCMNVAYQDQGYREILNAADLVYCDGTGVKLAARLCGLDLPERMTGADWIDDLCTGAAREGVSLFLLGGGAGAASSAATILRQRHPDLGLVGYASGYGGFQETIEQVNRRKPDILLVGMGTPRQERWIGQHRAELDVPVVWAVGALFDFVNGSIPRGPRWMTDHGLEWLCRLYAEPRKLWRRYLIGNPLFFWRVVREMWLGRRGTDRSRAA
jgi:N-acetylglucosaminyldiphosphoundecaprenol N-acetyl-beta-D-mannosaminyltransferase